MADSAPSAAPPKRVRKWDIGPGTSEPQSSTLPQNTANNNDTTTNNSNNNNSTVSETSSPSTSIPPAVDAKDLASLAAAKINAMLASAGKLPANDNNKTPILVSSTPVVAPSFESFEAEVEINDSPHRAHLARGLTHDKLRAETGVSITTRGMYYPPERKPKDTTTLSSKEKPLYLHVLGRSKESVDLAASRIRMLTGLEASMPGSSLIEDKVLIGIVENPVYFDTKAKIAGPGGAYLLHICKETGANVFFRGMGSAYKEPTTGQEGNEFLYLSLSHTTVGGCAAAKRLCEDLVRTVRVEYDAFKIAQGRPPGPSFHLPPSAPTTPAYPPAYPSYPPYSSLAPPGPPAPANPYFSSPTPFVSAPPPPSAPSIPYVSPYPPSILPSPSYPPPPPLPPIPGPPSHGFNSAPYVANPPPLPPPPSISSLSVIPGGMVEEKPAPPQQPAQKRVFTEKPRENESSQSKKPKLSLVDYDEA